MKTKIRTTAGEYWIDHNARPKELIDVHGVRSKLVTFPFLKMGEDMVVGLISDVQVLNLGEVLEIENVD